ncbi:MAG: lipocalin family protein [Prolixibacteraceae bacterium]|jgi:hypothetical protein|nr:lipocalin family protein [Prolixibacteraceae bacterium]
MKTLSLIFFFLAASLVSYSQEMNLVGQWHLTNIKHVNKGETNSMADEIRKGTFFLDFYFMQDGKFKQSGNAAGDGNVSTQEGTWKLTGKKLIITIEYQGHQIDVDYVCEQKGDSLVATRTSPNGEMSIINEFVKVK